MTKVHAARDSLDSFEVSQVRPVDLLIAPDVGEEGAFAFAAHDCNAVQRRRAYGLRPVLLVRADGETFTSSPVGTT